MSEAVLQVEVPDFGSSVLGSLNQQRLLGHYCDVSILVQGRSFRAHRAVLAASSLYFRDLFSADSSPCSCSSPGTSQVFELPSSVTPACFQQILTFCYTGRLSMAASEQLVLMYTAGYLQIQNIVERGLELLMTKASSSSSSSSSPLCCDSQSALVEELGLEVAPQQQQQGRAAGPNQPSLGPEELLLAVSRIKQERCDTPPVGGAAEDLRVGVAVELPASRAAALCYLGPAAALLPGLQSYLLAAGGPSSPGGSSQPTDSPSSHLPTQEELEEDYCGGSAPHGLYQHLYAHPANLYIQDQLELPSLPSLPSLPLATERRPCLLVGRDNMALPASLVSQIGYRCHPSLYTEGDPGEKVELVAGSGVLMTRGQLMNCHLCAGVKHKVLLRRLLATFFDRNTLANSCGTGIRSSTNDPSRRPLDNRVLNTVKLYCQNFAPSFKDSEMNVIAADMCTNARRVRKRWLPKIQSLLPDSLPPTSCPSHPRRVRGGARGGEGAVQSGGSSCHLQQGEEAAGGREEADPQEGGGGGRRQLEEVLKAGEADGGGGLQTGQPPQLPPPAPSPPQALPQDTGSAPSSHLPDTDH